MMMMKKLVAIEAGGLKLSIFGVLLIEFDSVAGCEHVGEYE